MKNYDYSKECKHFTDLAIEAAYKAEENLDKETYLSQARTYAQLAQAISYGVCYVFADSSGFSGMAQVETDGIKDEVPTKDALENQPAKQPEPESKPEPKEEKPAVSPEEGLQMQQDFERIGANIRQWLSADIGVDMDLILHWASQSIGHTVKDLNDLTAVSPDEAKQFVAYFKKLTRIFNEIGANAVQIGQALQMATKGTYTDTKQMSPDNIDIVIDIFEQAKKQQQA